MKFNWCDVGSEGVYGIVSYGERVEVNLVVVEGGVL